MPHAYGSPIGWSESARRSAGPERPAAREALARAATRNGAANPDEVVSDVLSLDLMSRQLNAMDVVVRDLARGLVDFRLCAAGKGSVCGRPLVWRRDQSRASPLDLHDAPAAGRSGGARQLGPAPKMLRESST